VTPAEDTITLREREFKGSRLRCLLPTNNAPDYVAAFLSSLVAPHALVTRKDRWAPRGFLDPEEAKLGETPEFLCEPDRAKITRWWLAQPGRANTPNWDLVSTCRIEDRRGLILAEAKAHEAEFSDDRSGAKNPKNTQQIENALAEATVGWNALASGFALSDNTHYQLSNIASLLPERWRRWGHQSCSSTWASSMRKRWRAEVASCSKTTRSGVAACWLGRKERSLRASGTRPSM